MALNTYLIAIGLFMVCGLTSNIASQFADLCPIKFPEGFFCDLICEKWGILTGNTIMCFISHQEQYAKFVARNPAFGIWRFYKVNVSLNMDEVCERALLGDEFFLNETHTDCFSLPNIPINTTPDTYNMTYRYEEMYQYTEFKPAVRTDYDTRLPMDAICELATNHICRLNKVINCKDEKQCCYANVPPLSCKEDHLSRYTDCYKGLYNVIKDV